MKKKVKMIALSALAMLGSAVDAEKLEAQGRYDIIAQTGQTAPDGNGTYESFQETLLNNSGQVAFEALLTGNNGFRGIFRGSGGSITQVVRSGQSAPDANGTFGAFQGLQLNDSGQVAFAGFLTGTIGGDNDDRGIFRGSGGSITQIARAGQTAPDANGTYVVLSYPALNNSGQVAFHSGLTGTSGGFADDEGIFRGSGGAVIQIARAGQTAPDGNGNYLVFFGTPALNNSGQTAFGADLTGTSGFDSDNTGIFRDNGSSITQIAREGQSAPDANGSFSNLFGDPLLNSSGQTAFAAGLRETSIGTLDDEGIFRGSGGSITQIVRENQAAPDSNGVYSFFLDLKMNDSGQVAFRAGLDSTSGGSTDDEGIFRGNGGSVTQIVREGQAAPDANGNYSAFGNWGLNDSGQVAIEANLTGTSGGSTDDRGIFTGDGIDLLQVARKGDVLGGSTIIGTALTSSGSPNESGQIAYRARLANGSEVIQRWTPDLHWRHASSSSWNLTSNWTLSLKPGAVHDVFIDPVASMTVTGPAASTTVRSLQIGGGAGAATLDLNNNVTLTSTNGISIAENGTLRARGAIAANIDNLGTIEVGSGDVANFNGSLNQNGRLRILSTGQAVIQDVFLGSGFVGGGTVIAAGELRPGNSAASVLYEGNLTLTGGTDTFIELGGLGLGQFDQMRVAGNLSLAGHLMVSLIDEYTLGAGQQYLIGEVDGLLTGEFSGLRQGALVGVFSGYQTFISYTAGDGNDIALITAIPEPGTPVLFALLSLLITSRRRKYDV